EAVESEFLNETAKLAERGSTLVQIDEVHLHAPLREKPKRLSCVGTLTHAEDLNFHQLDQAVIDRCPYGSPRIVDFVTPRQPSEYTYRPAWWVPGGHAQTLWGKFFRSRPSLPVRIERWNTPDGDFIDICRLSAPSGRPRLLFLHGLEGTIRSHYVAGFFGEALRGGWAADLLIFRGCGDERNRAPRFYHSGETGDLAFAIDRLLAEQSASPLLLAGVSL